MSLLRAPRSNESAARRSRWRELLVITFGSLAMGPTVGDVGSCGQAADALDPHTFFRIKDALDCRRCGECAIASTACSASCQEDGSEQTFPDGCSPLVHDGEVCLRALRAASCGDYRSFQVDVAPETPAECQFCPIP